MDLPLKSLFLLCLLLSSALQAVTQSFTLTKKQLKVKLDIPETWSANKDLFGLPLVLSGPMVGDTRPVISILPTQLTTKQVTPEQFKNMFSTYPDDRQKWIAGHKGTLLSLDPVQELTWKGNQKVSRVGSRYLINDISFEEGSYYLFCGGELYNLKYSMRDDHKMYAKDILAIIESFTCQ